jgi:Tol biopolymer transport system component/DNA-binding winged helix-turn-helix (wHTH) protein
MHPSATPGQRLLRFGRFEVDLATGHLRKDGGRIKLQEKPCQVLCVLLEKRGEIVSREELCQRLWPDGTLVDFEHSLNTAVKKVREALGDDADSARFVETVPKRGYRFIAPVNGGPISPAAGEPKGRIRRGTRVLFAGAAAVSLALAAAGTLRSLWPRTPTVSASRALTSSGRVMFPDRRLMHFPGLASDGTRIYFSQGATDPSWGENLAQVPLIGGTIAQVVTPLQRQLLHDISPDGSRLLVQQHTTTLGLETREGPLWALPLPGQGPLRLGDVLAHDAAWSSDGSQLAFGNGQDLYLAGWDGRNPRKMAAVGGRAYWIRWAPDDNSLRFTLVDRSFRTSLWEVSADGSGLRHLLHDWRRKAQPCCGEWSPDGRHFVFLAQEDGRSDIWIRREPKGFWRIGSDPVRLTSGPLNFASVIFGRDGQKLFAVSPQLQGTVLKLDPKSGRTEPYRVEGVGVRFSRDRKWMVYLVPSARTLWRSRVNGTDALQLTSPPLRAGLFSLSPDGKQVAFTARAADGLYKLYIVPSSGGAVRQSIPGDRQEVDPNWSPDGSSIMFGRPPDVLAEHGMAKAIYLLNLKSGQITTLPGSEGMFSPRWTPDGRYVIAMPHNNWDRLMRFDFATRKWSELVPYDAANPTLSPEGEWVYFDTEHDGRAVSRVRVRDGRIEHVFRIADVGRGTLMSCRLAAAIDLDGSPLLDCVVNNSELYVLNLGQGNRGE